MDQKNLFFLGTFYTKEGYQISIAGIWQHPAWKSDLHHNFLGIVHLIPCSSKANSAKALHISAYSEIGGITWHSWKQQCQYHSHKSLETPVNFCPIRIVLGGVKLGRGSSLFYNFSQIHCLSTGHNEPFLFLHLIWNNASLPLLF